MERGNCLKTLHYCVKTGANQPQQMVGRGGGGGENGFSGGLEWFGGGGEGGGSPTNPIYI